jgi:TIR domain/Pentapeptide repeats (8 copies)
MANPEHLAILKQGVKVWNQWRREHPNIRPNLSNAYFVKADFTGIDLGRTDLSEANLNSAILKNALLVEADLNFANLKSANLMNANLISAELGSAFFCDAHLEGANLGGANLFATDFSGANLSNANLQGVKFFHSILSQTNLSGAVLWMTSFENVDLRSTKGLEEVHLNSPSEISISTLIRSHGSIPESFLRKAGVPPSIIKQIPALIVSLKPPDYYTCFISCSSKDEAFAKRLYADLQAAGVDCWFAPHDMRIGDKIRPRIDESIRIYDKLLLVLSEHSVASQWVEHEVETAIGKELEGKPNVLFPIRLDEAVMQSRTGWASHIRLTRHIGDFTRWKNHDDYQQAFSRLLRDLKAGA